MKFASEDIPFYFLNICDFYLPPADRPGTGDYKMPSVRASARVCVRASVRHVFTKAFLSLKIL